MRQNLKKLRFMGLACVLVSFAYFLATRYMISTLDVESNIAVFKYLAFICLVVSTSCLFVQYIEGGDKSVHSTAYIGLTPFLLVSGVFLFYIYYPNLSVVIKVVSGSFYAVLLYTLLLLNNVILVVSGREGNIPVYRVALNWVQIVLLGISISLYTGVLRLPVQPIIQVVLVSLIALTCYGYYIWVYSSETDVRKLKTHEAFTLVAVFTMLTGWATLTTLFFPAETFLRGIFIASVFLLGLGYTQLYLRNSISKKNIRDYLLICLVFLVIMILFKP